MTLGLQPGSDSQFVGGLSPNSVCRMLRPRTSATRVGSRCAHAAAMRRTGHACSRATTSWPWASAAATCSRSAVSAVCQVGSSAGWGWGQAAPKPSSPPPPPAALHAEPYIMFSTDTKSLLCIRCFRDMQGWVEGTGGERAEGGLKRSSPSGSPQGEPGPLRGPRVGVCAGLRAAAAGGAGERKMPGALARGGEGTSTRLRRPVPRR